MKTILITGGAGFIGAHAAQALLAAGHNVVVLDNFCGREARLLKEERLRVLGQAMAPQNIIRGDILDRELLDAIFAQYRFDQVLHLAALTSVSNGPADANRYVAVNVTGTVNVLEAAVAHGVEHVIFASSAAVYGEGEVPHRETEPASVPTSLYGSTKAAASLVCAAWQTRYDIPVTVLRFFNVYGPWGSPEMAFFTFAENIREGREIALRGRTTTRDFVHIDDCVRAIVLAVDATPGMVLNVATGQPATLPQVMQLLETALGRPARVRETELLPGEIRYSLGDISLIEQRLSWRPQVALERGIADYAAWYTDWYVPWRTRQVVTAR